MELETIKKELRELYSIKDENYIHINDAADYCEIQIKESNQVRPEVMPKIAEMLNATINELAKNKYESMNEISITNENWNKMINQSESYGAYKILIELRGKFAEIDGNFTAQRIGK